MKAFEGSVAAASDSLSGLSGERAEAAFRLMLADRELMAPPREWLIRGWMFNHWYHHRGQLSVYLRLLDVPVPVIYGASADENPFAG